MKKNIYSISLLLSFLIVLSHEMIPHHHSGSDMEEISHNDNLSGHQSHHRGDDDHHHDAENESQDHSKKEHNHTFPFHRHLSVANDFDCLRIEINNNITSGITLLTVVNSCTSNAIIQMPEMDLSRFRDLPFLITCSFEPGAIGLRAPPSIA